jgi:phosphoribosylformylglycinamidine (FGAM) synthase PurS component
VTPTIETWCIKFFKIVPKKLNEVRRENINELREQKVLNLKVDSITRAIKHSSKT